MLILHRRRKDPELRRSGISQVESTLRVIVPFKAMPLLHTSPFTCPLVLVLHLTCRSFRRMMHTRGASWLSKSVNIKSRCVPRSAPRNSKRSLTCCREFPSTRGLPRAFIPAFADCSDC